MEPRTITRGRFAILGTILLFSALILALSAHVQSQNVNIDVFIPGFISLNLAIAAITLAVVSVSIGVDFFRKGAFTSFVITEIAWSFVLMILWIAAAGHLTSLFTGVVCSEFNTVDGFGNTIGDAAAQMQCNETNAVIAFSWLSWFLFLLWFVAITTFSAVAYTRGNPAIWTSPVVGTDFYYRNPTSVVTEASVQQTQMYPQQQYIGGPMQGGPVQPEYTGTQYPPTTMYGGPQQQTMQA